MEEILMRFEPMQDSSAITLWTGAIVGLVGIGLCAWLLFKKAEGLARQRNIILAMLFFFLSMIALGTSFFTFWTQQKTGPVLIYTNAVETSFGKTYFKDLKDASITVAGSKSLVNPNHQRNATRLLLIEQYDGKVHVLSEENYHIETILKKLRTAIQEWRDSEG